MADTDKIPHEVDAGDLFVDKKSSETNFDQPNSSSNSLTEKGVPNAHQQNSQDAVEKPTANHQSSVPNGGLIAWLQVMGGFCLFFNTWGILNAFGVFQTYYESGALFKESSSNISWIGSIQAYFVLLGGLFSGPIYDRGYLRLLLIIGSFGVVFGTMMLSICQTYWQVLLAQGFCIGLGAGFLFVPGLAVLPTYFNTRLGLVIGLAASGSSLGGVIYPIVFYRLINQIGFGWSVRILGFIALATLLIPIFFMKMRVKPPKIRDMIDWSAFTDWQYMTFVVGATIGFIGLYVMFFYISYFGEATGIADASLSFYIVPILNAASIFGRTLPNALGDKTGPLNIIAPGAVCCSIIIFAMLGVKTVASYIIVALLFGFFSGVFVATPPVCFVALTKDKTKIGTRIGMGFAMVGFGVLAGGPGGGSILGTGSGTPNWTGIWIYGAVTDAVAGIIFCILRVWRTGPMLKAKC